MPFSQELPKYALEALRPLLSIWERTGASDRRLREEQLTTEMLLAVSHPLNIALCINAAMPHYLPLCSITRHLSFLISGELCFMRRQPEYVS